MAPPPPVPPAPRRPPLLVPAHGNLFRAGLFEPENNVRFGLYYLSWLRSNFKSTNEVLLAYNVGHNRAKGLLSRDGDADSHYTRRVLGEYQRNMTSLPAT